MVEASTTRSVMGIMIAATLAILFQLTAPSHLRVEPGATVVISGASSGIGKHAALSLTKEGFHVFACIRKWEDGEALLESARKFQLDTNHLHPILLDVTKTDQTQEAVETVREFVGDKGLHGLVNNAGIGLDASTESSSVEHKQLSIYRRTFDVNFFGLVELTQAFLPLLRKGHGRIVMMSSVAGIIASPFTSAYASSKWAVEGFSDSLRRELLPLGVSVSVLEPSFIATPILSAQFPTAPAEPYKKAETLFWMNFWKSSKEAPTPKVTSKAIIHALRAKKPQTRYVVGNGAALLRFAAGWLPDAWLDSLIVHGQREAEFSPHDTHTLLGIAQKEFEI